MGEFFYWEGSYFLSTIMVSVGIFTLGGDFLSRSNIIPWYLFYGFITVVSTIDLLLYHMYGRWFILFFLPPALFSSLLLLL